jgi:4-hydroxy-2-oxoheptanedioate aldolase
MHNRTKQKLALGHTVRGCFLRHAAPGLVEILALCGWDFVVLDGEHSSLSLESCENLVRAAVLRGITPLVRVPANQPDVILRFMDTGAEGCHVPSIHSREDAERAVVSVKYYPLGSRGLGNSRAASFGLAQPLKDYVTLSNAETLMVIQVESAAALENIDEIVATPNVDVIFIGSTDLSQSLGWPGLVDHPSVEAASDRIAEAVLASGKALGVMAATGDDARAWEERGARYVAVPLESLLRPGSLEFLGSPSNSVAGEDSVGGARVYE